MRTERTGRTPHELVQLPDVTTCSSCGHTFTSPLYTTTWLQCSCSEPERGHLIYVCLRPECTRAETFDPPHLIQTGPTGSYR